MARDDQDTSNRDPYRDNDDVRNPLSGDERSGVRPDSKNEARGDARENVGNHSRNTDTSPPDRERDMYDADLERDNSRRR